jgi:Flp pilus assembly protein TadD
MSFKQCVSSLAKAVKPRSAIEHTLFLTLAVFALGVQALSPVQVFNKVKDSVVVVKTLDAKGKTIGQGSGVVLPSGKIGTNCHVVENGTRFQVGGGKQFVTATLWGSDEDKDICLLEARGLTATPAQLGQATRLKVGEPVYAVGAPRGLELSLSDGIVSQLRGGPPPFIQTTAAISPGSSGGGLFDAEGRLVGFTTLYIEGGQSLNFAMPVEWAGEIQPGKKAAQGRSEGEWTKRAIALQSAGNWTRLRDWCQQWTQTQPGNGTAWFGLGAAYNQLKRYTEAIEAYRQALRINPDDSNSWGALGAQYTVLQRHTEAIDPLRQAVRIDPENDNAWALLALSYNGLQRYTEAIDAALQSVRINPGGGAWFTLGGTYVRLRRHTEAIDPLRQAVRIDPDDANAWALLAISYEVSGNRIAALEAVRQLRRIDPARADELFNMIVPR